MSNDKRIEPVELSVDNELEAIQTFNEWLVKENYILLVVLGEGPKVDIVIKTANSLINDPGNFYKAARVVWARNPKFVIGKLKELEEDSHLPEINWDNFGNIAMVAITAKYNIITEVIKRKDVDQYIEGRIKAAYVLALGLDEKSSER